MFDEFIKALTVRAQTLSDGTIITIVALVTVCFVVYKAREVYKDYQTDRQVARVTKILEQTVKVSFENLRKDIAALTASINQLASKL